MCFWAVELPARVPNCCDLSAGTSTKAEALNKLGREQTAHDAKPTLDNCLSATQEVFALDGRAKDKRASVSMVVMERWRFDRRTARVQATARSWKTPEAFCLEG